MCLNNEFCLGCSYIVKATETQIQSLFSHLTSLSHDYSKWPLFSRTVCSSRSTTEDSDFFHHPNCEACGSAAKQMKNRKSSWKYCVKVNCLVMAMDGVQTSSQVPDGAGHCWVPVEFPWGVPHPILDGTAQRGCQLTSNSVECWWDL